MGSGARACDGAVRRRVRAHEDRHHRADDLALDSGGVDCRPEPRRGGVPGPGFFLRRASDRTRPGAGELRDFARQWLREHQVPDALAMLVAGPSTRNPDANYRLEFLRVGEHQAPADS